MYSFLLTVTCKSTVEGFNYIGRLSHTENGNACQRWDMSSPQSNTYSGNDVTKYPFPEKSWSDGVNFCRNPSSYPIGIWCYTMDPGIRWELCDVPMCNC